MMNEEVILNILWRKFLFFSVLLKIYVSVEQMVVTMNRDFRSGREVREGDAGHVRCEKHSMQKLNENKNAGLWLYFQADGPDKYLSCSFTGDLLQGTNSSY